MLKKASTLTNYPMVGKCGALQQPEGSAEHRVVGEEAGFGISVKNNSHRAYSGVNSTEKTLLGAPPLSRSPVTYLPSDN